MTACCTAGTFLLFFLFNRSLIVRTLTRPLFSFHNIPTFKVLLILISIYHYYYISLFTSSLFFDYILFDCIKMVCLNCLPRVSLWLIVFNWYPFLFQLCIFDTYTWIWLSSLLCFGVCAKLRSQLKLNVYGITNSRQ